MLGHTLLIQRLLDRGLLQAEARVVIVTGDIYVLVDAVLPAQSYRGPLGGQWAYCRSKLGNLWMQRACSRRHPVLSWYAVHPGVVASGLAVPRVLQPAMERMMLTCDEGAQTSVRCACEPGLPSGYYHNTMGQMVLPTGDPGSDDARADAFLDEVLSSLQEWLGKP